MSTQPQLSPLEQLGQDVQKQAPASQATPSQSLSPLELLGQDVQQKSQADTSGQITNDVGEQVIVPKQGESFADTMKRGVVLGKQRQQNGTQQQAIDKETATVPGKLPAVAGGVVGAASLPVIEGLAPEAIGAARALLQAHPEAAKTLGRIILGSALGNESGHSAKSAVIGALLGGLWK